jgi:hypothetical protein
MDNIAVRMMTEFRTKVLQETGAQWYHPDNAFWWLSKSAQITSSVHALKHLQVDPQ